MKQVLQTLKNGEVHVEDVAPPRLRPGGALVVTRASLISQGTERMKMELGGKSLIGKARARPELARKVLEKARQDGIRQTYQTVATRLGSPNLLGYSCCGRVEAVAPDCPDIAPGDLVACAGAGYANHAEMNFIPRNLMAKVPDGVSVEQAAYGTLGAIAMQGVRQAEVRLGDRVLVIGLGLVGLIASQLVRAAGGRVLGYDIRSDACELAGQLGVEQTAFAGDLIHPIANSFSEGVGVDSVIVCASTPSDEPIRLAAELCRDRGRIAVIGAVGMTLPRELFYQKELELRLSRAYGPGRYDASYEEHGNDYPIAFVRWTEQRQLAEFLRLLRDGLVDVDALTTHRFPLERAGEAYALISGATANATRPVGVLIEYPKLAEPVRDRTRIAVTCRRATTRRPVKIAAVGAGNFATRVLLPTLAGDERVQFVGVASEGGATAARVARRYGFEYATSDAEALIEDPDVDAVVIATRHDSHAEFAAQALRSGKSVFCAEPLATNWPELENVAAAFLGGQSNLLVGFNRRFSPLVAQLRSTLPAAVPRVVTCRINPGPPPAGHWSMDPVSGGGRIVGELCHFLDLACALIEGRPRRVSAEALNGAGPSVLVDSVVVHVSFDCGSIASIQYLGNGDSAAPKERVEVFSGGVVGLIDNFRRLEITRHGKRQRGRMRKQEKGHREELREFIDLIAGTATGESPAIDAFWSSALTLQVPVALGLGTPVAVELPASLGYAVSAVEIA
jgi:predicted dehydrogenase/threonine dehydrogenase-like Zn-dependent dehydrogenase